MTIARAFLAAASAGEDRSVELAEALAAVVLDDDAVKLALNVLEGGALTIARAIRLAESVIASVTAHSATTTKSAATATKSTKEKKRASRGAR